MQQKSGNHAAKAWLYLTSPTLRVAGPILPLQTLMPHRIGLEEMGLEALYYMVWRLGPRWAAGHTVSQKR